VGEEGLETTLRAGLGGNTGLLCILEGFGGKGGFGNFVESPVCWDGILNGVPGECVSMMCSKCDKQVLTSDIKVAYCFGWDMIAI
jgi:hypothetical protein